VIWVCPFLAFLDVASTFYVESQGYSLEVYERGLFASLFVGAGSIYIYLYAVIYLMIMVGIAYVFWYIKNRELKPTHILDKAFFLALIGVMFYICMRLTATFLVNFFLPEILERRINVSSLTWIIYGTSALSLSIYLLQPVLSWVRRNGSKKDK
jgi:hypothetical protein